MGFDFNETSSSPPSASTRPEDALAYYKAQYEQLESELAEFQASSQELEAELEKDVEAAEQRERALQQKAEELTDKVTEWQNKYIQAKTESGKAQAELQREVTNLRQELREAKGKLREAEIVNDDFEKKARETGAGLEDLERKWNGSIERCVMMEEDIRIGEQEREQLRIETQRLRDDLSDLRIEADVLRDKLKRSEAREGGQFPLPLLTTSFIAPSSPQPYTDDASPISGMSSPFIHTPATGLTSEITNSPTPPSPPISDRSSATTSSANNTGTTDSTVKPFRTPFPPRHSRIRAPSSDLSVTPKPSRHARELDDVRTRQSRGPDGKTAARDGKVTPAISRVREKERMQRGMAKPLPAIPAPEKRGLPNSNSLIHIRAITAQMQRLELRVQSARSKLPAPVPSGTPPPPPSGIDGVMGGLGMPNSVTIRSRKRTVDNQSVASSVLSGSTGDDTPSLPSGHKHVPRVSTSGISRLSIGTLSGTRPPSVQDGGRPPSRSSVATSNGGFAIPERPASRMTSDRPPSRSSTAHSGYDRPPSRTSTAHSGYERPCSRSSIGRQTPLGQLAESRRPRSSFGQNAQISRPDFSKTIGPGSTPGGSLRTDRSRGHGATQSVNRINFDASADEVRDVVSEYGSGAPTPSQSAKKSYPVSSNTSTGIGGGDGAVTPGGSAIPLPRRPSLALGRSPSSSIPASRVGALGRSPSGMVRSPSTSLSGISGVGRSPSSKLPSSSHNFSQSTSGISGGGFSRGGVGRGLTVAERMGRVHEGRLHVHDGLIGGKGERVTVSGQGVVGRKSSAMLREEQREELERKRKEREMRAKGLAVGNSPLRTGSRAGSRPTSLASGRANSHAGSQPGSVANSPRKVNSIREVDGLGETW